MPKFDSSVALCHHSCPCSPASLLLRSRLLNHVSVSKFAVQTSSRVPQIRCRGIREVSIWERNCKVQSFGTVCFEEGALICMSVHSISIHLQDKQYMKILPRISLISSSRRLPFQMSIVGIIMKCDVFRGDVTEDASLSILSQRGNYNSTFENMKARCNVSNQRSDMRYIYFDVFVIAKESRINQWVCTPLAPYLQNFSSTQRTPTMQMLPLLCHRLTGMTQRSS